MINNDNVLELLSTVDHPSSDKNIVELGLVEMLSISEKKISFVLNFKKHHDPFSTSIKSQCEAKLKAAFPDAEVDIALVFLEAKKAKSSVEAAAIKLDNIKHTLAIVSGKGGVGKSTITSNLAVHLAQQGYKVGVVDADVYGPSMPKMFGVESEKPTANDKEQIVPIEKFGVKLLSIGFFVEPDSPVIWRAPMATSALKQLLLQADWGALDFLLIDMPPGTGDIHLSLVQSITLSGAIVVSTPQQVALADAIKGINMLRSENINVPILGLVENMAWFTPAELPQNRYYIFGKDGVKALAKEMQIPLLGEIPLVQAVCDSGDAGTPIASLQNEATQVAFDALAAQVLAQLKT
ncbi:MAG: P-loop NTPase, partial [Bacteroidales bacterium]